MTMPLKRCMSESQASESPSTAGSYDTGGPRPRLLTSGFAFRWTRSGTSCYAFDDRHSNFLPPRAAKHGRSLATNSHSSLRISKGDGNEIGRHHHFDELGPLAEETPDR